MIGIRWKDKITGYGEMEMGIQMGLPLKCMWSYIDGQMKEYQDSVE